MRTLFDLFAKSPFGPLQDHLRKALECAEKVPDLFRALERGDREEQERLTALIDKLESEADAIKNRVRDNLPRSVFIPVDRKDLLDALSTQDSISDSAEDVAVLLGMKPLVITDDFREELWWMVDQVMATVRVMGRISGQLDELVEASFGGPEAEKVLHLIDKLGGEEYQADQRQHALLRKLLALEGKLSPVDIMMWMKVLKRLGDIANNAEKAGNRLRLFLSK